jgi:hypothetical protein
MKKLSLTLLASLLSLTGVVFAQRGPTSDITESTDESKAAAVEQRAHELAPQQEKNASIAAERKKSGGKSMAKAKSSDTTSSGASGMGSSDKSSGSEKSSK